MDALELLKKMHIMMSGRIKSSRHFLYVAEVLLVCAKWLCFIFITGK